MRHKPQATRMSQEQSPVLTTTDAARLIGVSAETIRLWEKLGKLAATKTASGLRLFRRIDCERAAAVRHASIEARGAK